MVTNDIYVIIREAIQETGEQRGRLYEDGHEAHYMALDMALAAVTALNKAGYSIEKRAYA